MQVSLVPPCKGFLAHTSQAFRWSFHAHFCHLDSPCHPLVR